MAESRRVGIALRHAGDDDHLDDVVIEPVEMFRAERLDPATLWLCCYLANGERITWQAWAQDGTLKFETCETPEEFCDWRATTEGESG